MGGQDQKEEMASLSSTSNKEEQWEYDENSVDNVDMGEDAKGDD